MSSRVSLVPDSIQDIIAAVNFDTLKHLSDLTKQLHADRDRPVSELEDARDAALEHRQESHLQARRPFSAVLIDGDGYIFQVLMNKGPEPEYAGIQAATQLDTDAIKTSARCHRSADHNLRWSFRIQLSLFDLTRRVLSYPRLGGDLPNRAELPTLLRSPMMTCARTLPSTLMTCKVRERCAEQK